MLSADVVIPVYKDVGITVACIESVLACSGDALGRLIVVNDCGPEPEMLPALRALAAQDRRMVLLENERNLGFIHSCNRGILLRQGDVVLLNSDTRVTQGWLSELLAVAATTDRTSCVVPLSNNATICSVPDFCAETKATEIDAEELHLERFTLRSTVLPTGVGFCLLLKDHVLNMVGPLDPDYGRGYNEENDWIMRAQRLGFIPLRANHAFVYHLGSISFGEERNALEAANAKLLSLRHPSYLPQVHAFLRGSEGRAAAHYVGQRMGKHTVCLDVRHVHAQPSDQGKPPNGTAIYAIELARHLSDDADFEVSALVNTTEQRRLVEYFDIQALTTQAELEKVQVLHRPAQVFDTRDLRALVDSPAHLVVTYQDLIAYRVPSVFDTFQEYDRYRATSHALLHACQAVVAISEHNRQELLEEFHLDPERVTTIHHGVDHERFGKRDALANRGRLEKLGVKGKFFLYAGADFPHKNLPLLLRAYARYRSQLGSEAAQLVLVGPSWYEKGTYLGRPRTVQAGVSYLGPVPDDALTALMQEALAFTYLSAYEGFGLPVLEAMSAGTPVICSSLSSLPEVAGDAALMVRSFSAEEIAAHLQTVTLDEVAHARLVTAGRAQAERFWWKDTARKTAGVYARMIERPSAVAFAHQRSFASLLSHSNLL